MFETVALVMAPRVSAGTVACLYIGAQTRHTWEKRETCDAATASSAGWTDRFALLLCSVETVGYT